MMATDLADYLVRRGVTFREAHGSGRQAGARERETAGVELDALPLASFAAAHATFGDDVLDALSRSGQSLDAIFRAALGRMRCANSWRPL